MPRFALTPEQVRAIRWLDNFRKEINRTCTREKLAERFGVSRGAIDKVIDGETWRRVV